MKDVHRSGRLDALVCLFITLVAAIVAVPPESATARTLPIEVYRSPEFGYLFWWDTNAWSVQQQEAETGSDWVQLASADTVVDIWAYLAPGVGADACLQERLDRLQSEPTLVRLEALDNPGAPAALVEWSDPEKASIEMVLGFDTAGGPAIFVAREECTAVPAAGFMLFTAVWRDAAAFNADNALDGGPVRTLTMPRSAWEFVSGEFAPRGPLFLSPEQVLGFDGGELGVLTTHTFFDCDTDESTVVVVAEGTAAANFVVDPVGFVVENDAGVVPPTSVRWIAPDIPSDNSAALGNGDVALLELAYTDAGQITYRNPGGNRQIIGGLGGCGGGGAAPIVIDLE